MLYLRDCTLSLLHSIGYSRCISRRGLDRVFDSRRQPRNMQTQGSSSALVVTVCWQRGPVSALIYFLLPQGTACRRRTSKSFPRCSGIHLMPLNISILI